MSESHVEGEYYEEIPRGNPAARKSFSIFVIALLFLAAVFAVAKQVMNLVPVLETRAESASNGGDFKRAMELYTQIRRIRGDTSGLLPKMKSVAVEGVRRHYERSKGLFEKGLPDEALSEFRTAMAISSDFFFVFPSEEFLAPKGDALISLMDTIAKDFCLRGRVHALQSEWDDARQDLARCYQHAHSDPSPLLWQLFVYSQTWDWGEAMRSVSELLRSSGMGALLNDFEKTSRGKQITEAKLGDLLPKELHAQLSVFDDVSWYELSRIIELMGMELHFSGPREIGHTGVLAPVDIVVRSAGRETGNAANILINGVDVAPDMKGYNVAALEQGSGKLIRSYFFDSISNKTDNNDLRELIESLPEGTIVILAAKRDTRVIPAVLDAFMTIGVDFAMMERDRTNWSHCAIGVKGASSGTALQAHGPGISKLQLWGPSEFGTDDASIKSWLSKRAAETQKPTIYAFGKGVDDRIVVAWP
ncbi:MAG: hypothetical protein JW759_07280 [Candidatus Coatesbacteria bacterium]|nr:hypothetical protein [Candidatus Coatesbacteria bacterium]